MMAGDSADRCLTLTPDSITARSGEEFRALLRLIREESGLTVGQIAYGSGICRSQVQSLGSTRLRGLPTLSQQVENYVTSCRLVPAQVALVMELWTTLHTSERD
jgi:hypothetical protein